MSSKLIFSITLAISVAFILSVILQADTFVRPEPSKTISADGSRVFVFNPPTHLSDSYPAMGVYLNTEPLELNYIINIWDINRYGMLFESDFILSSDFEYFALIPTVSKDTALRFYARGRMVKTYYIEDLVHDMSAVLFTVSTAWWENWRARDFDPINNRLTITTVEDITYTFDIRSGEIININEPYVPTSYEAEQDTEVIAPPDEANTLQHFIPLIATAMAALYFIVAIIKKRCNSYSALSNNPTHST